MKGNSIFQKDSDAIKNAICHYVVLHLDDRLSDEQFYKVVNFIDPFTIKRIDDATFLSNSRLKTFIDYKKLNRKQVIRLMTRDITIFDRIELDYFKFTVNELQFFIAHHPKYIRKFDFDLKNLTGKEVLILLKADMNFIYEIDFETQEFSRLDFQDLIKYFSDIDEAMSKLNFANLDNFLVRTLLILTQDKYISKVSLDTLNYLDWLEILKNHPELIKYCELSLFTTGDCFKLAQLVCVVPSLDYLVEQYQEQLSPLAWEKLLLFDTEKYSKICNFKCFKEINWKNILRRKPYLIKYKDKSFV